MLYIQRLTEDQRISEKQVTVRGLSGLIKPEGTILTLTVRNKDPISIYPGIKVRCKHQQVRDFGSA